MKKILLIATLFISFGISQSNAQFLKKLKERALEKTQEVIIDKAADKVAEKAEDKTGEVMDKFLNPDFEKLMSPSGKKVDRSKLPSSYNFDYRYALKISTQDGEFDFDYFLSKTEPYMGVKMNVGGDMSMVFDEGNKIVLTSVGGVTVATEMDMSEDVEGEEVVDVRDGLNIYNDFKFKKLPNRNFLGHSCVGNEMENDEYKFIVYIAPDMEAGFGNMFKSEHANLPAAMQKFSQEHKDGLMMYMEMVDKNNTEVGSVIMECVAFEPTNLVINTK